MKDGHGKTVGSACGQLRVWPKRENRQRAQAFLNGSRAALGAAPVFEVHRPMRASIFCS